VRIDSSGNVGIGTSSPSTFNQRVTAPHLVVGTGGNAAGLTLYSGTTNQSSINFAVGTTTSQQYDGGFTYVPNAGSPYLSFHVNAGSERMRIDSAGKIQIGNNIPMWSGSYGGALVLKGNNATSDRYAQLAIVDSTGAIVSQGLIVDTSGYVGLGTSSPNTKLDVVGSTTNSSGIVDTLRLRNTGVGTGDGAKIQFTAGTSTSGAGIGSGGVALNSADLRFYSGGNTERMRIAQNGSIVYYGSTVAGAGGASVGSIVSLMNHATIANLELNNQASTGYYAKMITNGGSQVGSISYSAAATAYNTSSDYRLKTDAQPMTGASARVQALKPVNFEWISSGERVDGFLAHEAQEVVPECVTGTKDAMRDEEYEVTAAVEATYDEDGNELTAAVEAVMGTRSVPDYQGIDQSKLVPLLTAALQEALNKIDAMEIRLAALENN
jgi:hypothetical protein